MTNKEFLNLAPERFLCPICGCWHKWENSRTFGSCTINIPAKFTNWCGKLRIYTDDDYLYYSIFGVCVRHKTWNFGKVLIAELCEAFERDSAFLGIITFPIKFRLDDDLFNLYCGTCYPLEFCNKRKYMKALSNSSVIRVGFQLRVDDYSLL